MDVYARRSLSGLIQLWITIVLPPVLIIIYLIYLKFDVSKIETAYWIVGVLLLIASVLYAFLFGRTMFLPDIVIDSDDEKIYIHTGLKHVETVEHYDIVDVMAVKNSRMMFLRLNAAGRMYGKLIIKTMQKKYELYPVSKVDDAKKRLDKLIQHQRI